MSACNNLTYMYMYYDFTPRIYICLKRKTNHTDCIYFSYSKIPQWKIEAAERQRKQQEEKAKIEKARDEKLKEFEKAKKEDSAPLVSIISDLLQ